MALFYDPSHHHFVDDDDDALNAPCQWKIVSFGIWERNNAQHDKYE